MPDALVGQDSDFSEEHRKAFVALPIRAATNPDIVALPLHSPRNRRATTKTAVSLHDVEKD